MAAGACRGRCAAAPLPLLSAWGRLRCGSACHRRGSQAGEADAVRRPARDAEAQLPDGTGWPTRSASGVTTTSALGVRFNTRDGAEFDKTRIVPYAWRHSYAQRHADAGVPIDVLAELLDHRNLNVTRRYYRVGEDRRRAAVDTVTALSFDRHGNRIWRDAQALLESEHARYAIGEVAVPYGTCSEPSNVQAGGGACPVRFRCIGCDHYRTTVAHLPDLQAYLDDLLRTRERLAATTIDGVDDWARTDATPTKEEITRIRRLINRIKGDVAELDQTQRAGIDEAVAVVRRHRAAHAVPLGMPTVRGAAPAPLTTATPEATA